MQTTCNVRRSRTKILLDCGKLARVEILATLHKTMKQDILLLLRANKIKLTNERKEIINVLKTTNAPLSPANLYLMVKTSLPRANLTTVYRNLEMLEGLGLVKDWVLIKAVFIMN